MRCIPAESSVRGSCCAPAPEQRNRRPARTESLRIAIRDPD